MSTPLRLAGLLFALAAGSAAQGTDLPSTTWRAWLDSPGGELPFGLAFARGQGELEGWILNGSERIPIPRVAFDGTELALEIDHYDARIVAVRDGETSRFDGEWTKRSGGAQAWSRLAFHMEPGHGTRFRPFGNAGPNGRIAGRWSVDFESDELPAVALFEESGVDGVTGTFLTATGDYRYLAGTFQGDRLRLSVFDGAHAFLFDAVLADDGTLRGDFWSRDSWHETWSARRDPDAALPDPFAQTEWNDRVSLADLVYPDLDGNPRSLADPAFAGRAILLQVFGSWCPNCHDETAYLVELHRRYADRGLSILGLAFELTGDFDRDAKQVRRFVRRHGVEYPILVAGTADKTRASLAFPALDRVRAFPTTIFLSGDGRVRAVHSGFAGPATGEAHDRLRREFEGRIEALLAERIEPDAGTWRWLTRDDWFAPAAFAGARYRFHRDDGGDPKCLFQLLGSGVPVVDEEVRSVTVVGDAVWVGAELLRIDRRAGLLLDPSSFGGRLYPEGDGVVPALLRERGLLAEPDWIAALSDGDPLVRREALVALARQRKRSSENQQIREAVGLLEDPDVEVRVAAAWAAGRCYERRAVALLVAGLDHPNAALRRESVIALDRMATRDAALREPVERLADDPDPLVRSAVERALRRDRR